MTANVRCVRPCGWEGPSDDARTGYSHLEQGTTVYEYRCPECGDHVEMTSTDA